MKGEETQPTTARPSKKKITEIDSEPPCHEIEDTSRNINLLTSAVSDYCKFKCKTEHVKFKDTLMLQTRVFE